MCLVGRGRGMILVEPGCFFPLPTIWGDIGVSPIGEKMGEGEGLR